METEGALVGDVDSVPDFEGLADAVRDASGTDAERDDVSTLTLSSWDSLVDRDGVGGGVIVGVTEAVVLRLFDQSRDSENVPLRDGVGDVESVGVEDWLRSGVTRYVAEGLMRFDSVGLRVADADLGDVIDSVSEIDMDADSEDDSVADGPLPVTVRVAMTCSVKDGKTDTVMDSDAIDLDGRADNDDVSEARVGTTVSVSDADAATHELDFDRVGDSVARL